ncbi:HTH-type transcriptional activator HxlR (modular protein) [Pseudodesulfovibrio profundus]|uniref:HTH-type transcriptional activator HxlR (Modular protein) n=1 Tax=Pseudodesulfovibrio profundus TaxID=57320 RepID=A0A2C8F963_9BACT|nr:helix-turn-helix domain-containing protein [Pseudodesulfovibrio profundus]SOB58690.1 HTH-type transcriptional activator HxlR (modular protein) [Pseudodesulfovibrio profundus]
MKVGISCDLKRAGDRDFRCFFELSQQVIGGKWKFKILFYLSQNSVMRFGELRDAIYGISEKVLIQQLKELAADQIVHREVYKQVPPKVEYSLTPLGQTLIPTLENLFDWGQKYASHLVAQKCNMPIEPGEILDDIELRVKEVTD